MERRLVTSGVNEILGIEAPLGSESSCVDGSGSREGESKKPDFIHVFPYMSFTVCVSH